MTDTIGVPRIAILGRPNVGKSTLFNILTNTRKAVVRNEPGVTRDLQFETAEWLGRQFEIVDSGGLTESTDLFSQLIRKQVLSLLRNVDGILFVVDGRAGLCAEDREIFKLLKAAQKPFCMIVNKLDQEHQAEINSSEFYEFGEDLILSSFERRRGLDEILEWILNCKTDRPEFNGSMDVTLALLGKPNVGKSSLVNHILNEERMIVSPIAGTTVDAIDSYFQRKETRYCLIDTAGLRKRARREHGVEILSGFKSEQSIRRADIVLLMIDGLEGPSDQDAKICEMVVEQHKGIICVVNKSDLGEEKIPEFRKTLREKISQIFHFFDDIPIAFISAETGQGIEKLFDLIEEVQQKLHFKVTTSELNDFFFKTLRKAPAPVTAGVDVKFYYLTQTRQSPPSFIAFANKPEGVNMAYKRFLIRNLKEKWDLYGIPIRIFAMKSQGTIRESFKG